MRILGPDNQLLSIAEWAELQPHDTGEPTMRITRLRLRNFRSFEALDIPVPPAGLKIAGPNAIGKSNLLRAIRTALTGVGVAPDAIRDGENDCEILVDTDDPRLAHIRQRITARGGTLTVKTPNGDTVSRPREQLLASLDLSCFDALAFYRATPREQRRMLVEAMAVLLTQEEVGKWTEGAPLPALDLTRNGLEVLSQLHKHFYDLRAQANKDAEATSATLKLAQDEAERLHALDTLPKGTVVPLPGKEEEPVRAAEKAREALEQRRQQAEAMAKRTEGTRARIAELRGKAAELLAKPEAVAPMSDAVELVESELRKAAQELEEAQRRFDSAKTARDLVVGLVNKAAVIALESSKYNGQADDLEASIAATAIEPPTADEFAQADAAVVQARAHLELVRSARAAHDATARVCVLVDEDEAAKAEAARLDRIVKTLAEQAPVELAARANLIPGLTLTEDGVLYQGRPIDDSMSGAQRMLVAVQISKRANAKAGLMIVDEIGILDDEHMREFVRLCTADGWQLISTCMRNVTGPDGKPVREMVLEAIELDQDQASTGAAA